MPLLRRIMYTSSGSDAPRADNLTSNTDAAGRGVATAEGSGMTEPPPFSFVPTDARPWLPPPLQANQLGDLLAVVRGVAERELGGLRALEVEVQVVLPREADAAVKLD